MVFPFIETKWTIPSVCWSGQKYLGAFQYDSGQKPRGMGENSTQPASRLNCALLDQFLQHLVFFQVLWVEPGSSETRLSWNPLSRKNNPTKVVFYDYKKGINKTIQLLQDSFFPPFIFFSKINLPALSGKVFKRRNLTKINHIGGMTFDWPSGLSDWRTEIQNKNLWSQLFKTGTVCFSTMDLVFPV